MTNSTEKNDQLDDLGPNNPISEPQTEQKPVLSYGQKRAGVSFNPTNNPKIDKIKNHFAALIDEMNDVKTQAGHSEKGRAAATAITQLQTAKFWAIESFFAED